MVTEGEYGKRNLENIQKHGLDTWEITVWKAASRYPLIIDYPADNLIDSFEPDELILSFAENKNVAELLPEITEMTGAKGIVVALFYVSIFECGLAIKKDSLKDLIIFLFEQ